MNATKNTSFILSIDIRHSLLQLQKFNVNNSRELFLTDNYLKKSSFLCLQLEEIIPQTPCCSELMCNWERSTEFERSHMAKVKYFGVKIPLSHSSHFWDIRSRDWSQVCNFSTKFYGQESMNYFFLTGVWHFKVSFHHRALCSFRADKETAFFLYTHS